MYKLVDDDNTIGRQIEELKLKIELLQKQKSKLLLHNASGVLTDKEFLDMSKACVADIEDAEREIAELEQAQLSKSEFRKHIDTIRRILREAERDAANGIINKEFVDRYIDKIFVTPEDSGTLRLQIKLYTGETTDKYLTTLRSRTGHTFKKKDALTDEQVSVLLDTVKGLPPYVFIMIGLYAGLRREEILPLQWDCVFLDATTPYISVQRAWRA